MKLAALLFAIACLSSCADGDKTLLNTFRGMRESACEQRCEAMRAEEQLSCRRLCSASSETEDR